MTGKIVRKQHEKGFGFIKPDEGDRDIFFHAQYLVDVTFDELKEGDNLSFEISNDGPKGPFAINVRRI